MSKLFERSCRRVFNGTEFDVHYKIVLNQETGAHEFGIYAHYGSNVQGNFREEVKVFNPVWEDHAKWNAVKDFDADLYRIARFNYALVSTQMKQTFIRALNLYPLSDFDDYLRPRKIEMPHYDFLKGIGYGVLENDKFKFEFTGADESEAAVVKGLVDFPEGFEKRYEDYYSENNKLQTATRLTAGLLKLDLGADVSFEQPFATMWAANIGKRENINDILRKVRREVAQICDARQPQLIKFFFDQLKIDFPNLDPRKELR